MLEDPLEVVTDSVKEIIPEEAPKDPLVTAVTDPEEADTSSTEEAELFSRVGSVPLVVEDAEDKVQEVESSTKDCRGAQDQVPPHF